jgi:hypothetical protein
VDGVIERLRAGEENVTSSCEDVSGIADKAVVAVVIIVVVVAGLDRVRATARTISNVVDGVVERLRAGEENVTSSCEDVSGIADKAVVAVVVVAVVVASLEGARTAMRTLVRGGAVEGVVQLLGSCKNHVASGGEDICGIANEVWTSLGVTSLDGIRAATRTPIGDLVDSVVERLRTCEKNVASSGEDVGGVADKAMVTVVVIVITVVAGLQGVRTATRTTICNTVHGVVERLGTCEEDVPSGCKNVGGISNKAVVTVVVVIVVVAGLE